MNLLAIEALTKNQRQLDVDGVEVGVSRQALDELIAAYTAQTKNALVDIGRASESIAEMVADWYGNAPLPNARISADIIAQRLARFASTAVVEEAAKPVAWQYRYRMWNTGDWSAWSGPTLDRSDNNPECEWRPLFSSHPKPQTEGDMVLVPREPTPEMLGAWYRYKNGHYWKGEEPPRDTSDVGAYRAMLAAVVTPPKPSCRWSVEEVKRVARRAIDLWRDGCEIETIESPHVLQGNIEAAIRAAQEEVGDHGLVREQNHL
ncbi:hypothetical protein [Mesorhizobium sp.]|uniref:hypothetical protein n=1 Tax=Mesorhizobium sp. TaxID=1871066 RepID=UPI000FE8CB23|nr:hypothetical protein [Mesorhizobium sp.]RWO22803.1 MAG: hypothetical protein EOS09_19215 [Mesorhizobium sp.]